MDFYAILGIPVDADQNTIRSAYKILARRYHPDKGAGSSSEQFRQVAEAYETLIDPGRRQRYDLSLLRACRPVVRGPIPVPPEPLHQENPDIFGSSQRKAHGIAFRSSLDFDQLLLEWIRSFDDDLLFRTFRRW